MLQMHKVTRWPVFHRSGRYFTANLAEAGKKPVFENQCLKPIFWKYISCSNCKKN